MSLTIKTLQKMPNHIQCRLKLIGTPQEVEEVLASISGTYDDGTPMRIDFNKILPMPESLMLEINMSVESAAKCALGIAKPYNQGEKPLTFNDSDWANFLKCLSNARSYGHIYWYDWSIENWGTKWNAYSQEQRKDSIDTIYFQTAWNAPVGLMKLLSEKHPSLQFEFTYADEDGGSNTGRYLLQNGQEILKETPESQSIEGYNIYFELHPESLEWYKLIDGKYECIDS